MMAWRGHCHALVPVAHVTTTHLAQWHPSQTRSSPCRPTWKAPIAPTCCSGCGSQPPRWSGRTRGHCQPSPRLCWTWSKVRARTRALVAPVNLPVWLPPPRPWRAWLCPPSCQCSRRQPSLAGAGLGVGLVALQFAGVNADMVDAWCWLLNRGLVPPPLVRSQMRRAWMQACCCHSFHPRYVHPTQACMQCTHVLSLRVNVFASPTACCCGHCSAVAWPPPIPHPPPRAAGPPPPAPLCDTPASSLAGANPGPSQPHFGVLGLQRRRCRRRRGAHQTEGTAHHALRVMSLAGTTECASGAARTA